MRSSRFTVITFLLTAPLFAFQAGQPGAELVGTWVYKAKAGDHDQYWTIRTDAGKWTVQGLYKKDGVETGSFVGEGVTFDGKSLRYTHKYVKKPTKGADNVPVTLVSEGSRLHYSWTVNDVIKSRLLDRVAADATVAAPVAPPAEPKAAELDPAGRKLLGTFAAKVDRMFSVITVNYEQGAWSVSGLFKENGRDVGGFDGSDIQYEKSVLTFKQKFFLKPRAEWKDNETFTLRLVGNQVVGLPDRSGAALRSFERIDIPATTPAANLKKDDPRRFVGAYRGAANDGTRGVLVITESGGNFTYHATWYSASGKIVGSTIGVDIRVLDGNLVMVQRHLKKPHASWHDNATVRLELLENALTQTRQEGARWVSSASFTRAAR